MLTLLAPVHLEKLLFLGETGIAIRLLTPYSFCPLASLTCQG